MPDQPSPVHFRNPEKPLGPAICGEPYGARTSEPGRTTCFTCRKTEVFKRAQDGMPMKLADVLAEGVGVPTPDTVVRIEPATSGHVLFTMAQFMTAANIIRLDPQRHYDIVEERFKQDSVTWARLMLWCWPETMDQYPVRYWIEPSGHAALTEDCTWITEEEWPAWAKTGAEK